MQERRAVDVPDPAALVDQVNAQDVRHAAEVVAVLVVVPLHPLVVVVEDGGEPDGALSKCSIP